MRILLDLDGVIADIKTKDQKYSEVSAIKGAKEKIKKLREAGHYIIIYTARHMKTCDGNISKVLARVGLDTLKWLDDNGIQYDEVAWKPFSDIIIDDNALRFTTWDDIADDGSNLPKSHETLVRGDNWKNEK
jgi:capsule biosynthesis phosphatase